MNKKQTSRRVAHDASKALKKRVIPKKEKEFAGSALSQAKGNGLSKIVRKAAGRRPTKRGGK